MSRGKAFLVPEAACRQAISVQLKNNCMESEQSHRNLPNMSTPISILFFSYFSGLFFLPSFFFFFLLCALYSDKNECKQTEGFNQQMLFMKGLLFTQIPVLYYWNTYKNSSYRRPCIACLSHVLVSHKFHCIGEIFMLQNIRYCYALILVNMAY